MLTKICGMYDMYDKADNTYFSMYVRNLRQKLIKKNTNFL